MLPETLVTASPHPRAHAAEMSVPLDGADPFDFMEFLLGTSPSSGQRSGHPSTSPDSRRWWRIERRGSTRFLFPVDQRCRDAALELAPTKLAAWGLRLRSRAPSMVRAWPTLASLDASIPLDDLVATVLPGSRFDYAIYCGTPSIFRKYTIQCIDKDGRAAAYIKISEGPAARDAIINEVQVLERLAVHGELAGCAPRVIGELEQWNRSVSVLSAPREQLMRASRSMSEPLTAFARALFASESAPCPWRDSLVRDRLLDAQRQLGSCDAHGAAALVAESLEILDRQFGGASLPHGRIHGDLLPWNVRLGVKPYVFDWEWSRLALPMYDAYHFLLFPLLHRGGLRSDAQLRAFRGSSQLRRALELTSTEALPFGPMDDRWWLAYVAQAYAFYGSSTAAAGQQPDDQPLTRRLGALLRTVVRQSA